MNKKIVIFDFDGVIADTFSLCFKIVDSREYITEPEYRRRFEGNVFDAKRKFKDPNTTLESFDAHYAPEVMKCETFKGIADAIKALSEKYTLVIVSSTDTVSIDSYLKSVNLRHYFKEILGSDVDRSKVKKIQTVLKDYKAEPADAIFITDTLGDIKEGDHCEVESIAVTWGYNHAEVLKRGRPYAIVNEPAELVQKVTEFLSS